MPKDTNTIIINGVASYFIFNLEKLNEAEKSQKYFFWECLNHYMDTLCSDNHVV